ncbi:hypothetical protein Hmuk_0228 [Halomicrobium mukohataei DSM 12286]|uniref:Uncharacterized protein n=1 Tax=Halomicrobium mukohataei (strain ATCC 700874 / DSM 12286 / JCM 9738 / NCIMB 13541) TaxID=485914 RepID=C7NX00_HALMD|nr:hypothetical protein Hmuk_0228 [Halomicrobium mukohataei DSM 12286]
MVFELIAGFVALVAASYIGTTMALRGYFGATSFDRVQRRESGEPNDDDSSADD